MLGVSVNRVKNYAIFLVLTQYKIYCIKSPTPNHKLRRLYLPTTAHSATHRVSHVFVNISHENL